MPTLADFQEWRNFRLGERKDITAKEAAENVWEFSKDFVPYVKYMDKDERERFLKLSQQEQTRELLLQNLETLVLVGGGEIAKGITRPLGAVGERFISPVFKKTFPKTVKNIEKIAEAVPSGADELPKYAGSVNLQRQAIPKELKLAELRISDGLPKKKVTWAQVDVQSAEVMKDPKKIASVFEKWKRGEMPNLVEQDVVRKANVEGVYSFQKKLQGAKTPEEAQKWLEAYKTETFIPASEIASEQGRMLQSYNKEIGLNRIGKAFSKLERGLNKRELDAFKNLDLDDAAQVKRFAENLGDPALKDYFYEYWYNSILSGIPTHVVNVASNTAWRMFQIPHRALTGGVDSLISVLRGGKRDTFIRETIPLWAGQWRGKTKAVRAAWQVARQGYLTEAETKWAQEVGSSLGAFERSPYRALNVAGKFLTLPTKALRAMDVYANSLAYDGQMAAIARRMSIKNKLSRNLWKETETAFKLNPPSWAHKEAMDFAKYSTFMSDPGKISSSIINFRENVPGTRLVIPFVNTIGNLMKRGLEMTPGVGLGLARGQKPAEVIAKQIEGLIISAYMLSKAEKGEITGAAPESAAARERFYAQGKKAWGIKIGDTWYQYRRIEPFNTVLANAAIFHRRMKEFLDAGDEEGATKTMWNMANDFKNNLIDSSYLQGVTNILDQYGTAKTMAPRMVASMVPYSGFWRSINRSYEAYMEGSAKVYDHRDIMGSFAQVIPGGYKLREPKLNVWGEEIVLPGNVFEQWLPYKYSKVTNDKTELFLEKLDSYPGLPSQMVTYKGTKFKLDDDIYRQMVVDGGRRLKKWLDKKVENSKWQKRLETDRGREYLKKMIGSRRDAYFYAAKRKAIKEQLKEK